MHLIVIDMQEKLLPRVEDSERVLLNTYKLINAFKILNLPVSVTEQRKLGKTVKALRITEPVEKTTFSCMGCEEFVRRVMGYRHFVLAGIETHICVMQTALDMIKYGFDVYLAVDCTSSRSKLDRDVAVQRMIQEGIKVTTAEAVMYELIRDAEHEKFRDILELVKMSDLNLNI
ncbi:MAG: hydrolase [Archaeoglobus sp.]|nr:MAG: hydrolase [Archaeoglobus sp.]